MSGTAEQVENPLEYDPTTPAAPPSDPKTLASQWLGFMLLYSWVPDSQVRTVALRRKVLNWFRTLQMDPGKPYEITDRDLLQTEEWRHGWYVKREAFMLQFQKFSFGRLTDIKLCIDVDELLVARHELPRLAQLAAERCGITSCTDSTVPAENP